jgi:chemotaxis family two-component system response regulator PixG
MNHSTQSNLSNQLIYLKRKQFTGQVNIQTAARVNWRIYLCLGRLVWADGGIHSYRSWKRLFDKYCPQVDWYNFKIEDANQLECGDYYILNILLQRKLLAREQAIELVKTRATETLFDLLQLENQQSLKITPETASTSSFLTSGLQMSISLVNIEEVLYDGRQSWLIWQQKGLQNWSPNLAPMMRKQDRLREEVSGIVYQNFLRLLDGQRTLRDLSSRMGKDVRKLTSSLIPYVQQGLLDLLEVEDISPPKYQTGNSSTDIEEVADLSIPLIVCIDDSPQVGKIMKHIITKCGYRFLSIQESLQALPKIIQANPDFIFLDIGMPIVNGYEICSQVRRVSKLKNIPIVMLTGNDGIIDRMRAKVAGADAFVAKPIEVEKIVDALNKHLSPASAKPNNVNSVASNFVSG